MIRHKHVIGIAVLVLACAQAIPAFAQTTVNVSTVAQLQNAVNAANSAGGNTTISVADGTYTLNATIQINAPNISIVGQSGAREKVIIQGDAMSSSARVGSVILVMASNFQLSDVTLQKSRYHLIQVAGELNADAPVIKNCILRDAYEQMLKVSNDASKPTVTSDNGVVENCIFEYSAGIGPQYYIGGIDAHATHNWVVRGNTFRHIISPSNSVAEFAVHFWDGSRDNLVERNRFINCDRAIGFGMDGRGNTGGIIRNNMIYHASGNGSFADVGIAAIDSPNTQIYNNTVYMEHSFPWAIEYRFAATKGVQIFNNLTNKPVMQRDGASGTVSKNVSNATAGWFKDVASGDLHLKSAISGVVDAGQTASGLSNDFDGQPRPQGSGIDIGADEFSEAAVPAAPTNLRVN